MIRLIRYTIIAAWQIYLSKVLVWTVVISVGQKADLVVHPRNSIKLTIPSYCRFILQTDRGILQLKMLLFEYS